MAFFKRRSNRRLEKEYRAYDRTSISPYSQTIKQVKYANNKEHDPPSQISLALLFGEFSGLPAYYRKIPENIVDVKTIMHLLKDLDFMAIRKVNLVMDCGFYSEKNINELYRQHHKFLISGKTSFNYIGEKLEEIRTGFDTRSYFNSKTNLYILSFSVDWAYSEIRTHSSEALKSTRRIYVHN